MAEIDPNDTRYLSLIRELAAATQSECTPECDTHRQDAAWHINAILGNPELLWKLIRIAARFDHSPPPGLDDMKRSFSALAERQDSSSAGSSEETSSDG